MSAFAPSTKAMVMLDLQTNPLGMKGGEANLQAPFNSASPTARVFLVNWSATERRKYTKVAVSFKRGAAKALAADAQLAKVYNLSTIREAVADGQDMSVYDYKIAPALFAPMWNGVRYPIPPAKDKDSQPLRVQVPEGLWDLLMGNYERMHSDDPKERAEESMRLAISQTWKHSPILRVRIDDAVEERDNEFGFIEIVRQTEHLEPVQPTSEFLTAMELVEN
jgi:hypothetical protein